MDHRRRGALALLTGSALLLASSALSLSVARAEGSSVSILSSKEYVDPFSGDVIEGEVQNIGTAITGQVAIGVTWLDSAGQPLGPESSLANSTVEVLGAGDRSPFSATVTPPPGWNSYTLTASSSAPQEELNHNFTVTVTSQTTDADGFHHLLGTVRNDNAGPADAVSVVATLYDASRQADDQAVEATLTTEALQPGASRSFDALSNASGRPYSTVAFTAQSPSTPSPTMTPSPQPSETASPGPSPTQSPGDVRPSVTLEQPVINAGQQVTVDYQGQPNSTLTISSKTQPATGYTVIKTVTLDSTGFGTSTHAPQRNTRIMAETQSGLTSGQPLIQVHSVASFNATRVAPRTYTFTGRVYPALSQRLVSVYRNGILFAQGRCDARGIYVITKAVPVGSFSVYARTSNDTYNLGVTSRTLRMTSS